MEFRIETTKGIAVGEGLGRTAPAIRLEEGRVAKGGMRPLDLWPGGQTLVTYPLLPDADGKKQEILCRVIRTDAGDGTTASAKVEEKPAAPEPKHEEQPVPPIPTAGGRRSRRRSPA